MTPPPESSTPLGADLERRFGALRRLWGQAAYDRARAARVAVVGVGGVGSWCAEALARCGVSRLVLIDFDQIAESNINRQVQATGSSVGAAKVEVLRQRIADINPACEVMAVEAFVEPDNWPQLLPAEVDVVVDACDQARAKFTLARWHQACGVPLVCVGAAGGRTSPWAVQVADLALVTHDRLLARLRSQLRQQTRRDGHPGSASFGIPCIFSREQAPTMEVGCNLGLGLNCGGYGSSVMVTATFGMAAAEVALARVRSSDATNSLPESTGVT